MRNSRSLSRSDHRRHDRLLVARYAGGDSYPGEMDEARSLVTTCSDCAALVADIQLLASSMADLPRPTRARDFRLTADQAQRLRGSRLERWLRTLGGPGWATLRPVAGVAMSIGLVLAIVGGGLPVPLPAALPAARPAPQELQITNDATRTDQPPAVPAEGAPEAPTSAGGAAPSVAPQLEAAGDSAFPPTAAQTPAAHRVSERFDDVYVLEDEANRLEYQTETAAPEPTFGVRDILIYAGLGLAAISLGLLSLAWFARRRFADPLLR